MKKCKAYNHLCKKCNVKHHLEAVCRNQPSHTEGFLEDSAAVFDTLCTVVSTDFLASTVNAIVLDHHIYNELCDTWQKRQSDKQPIIKISVHADPSHIQKLGLTASLTGSTPIVSHTAMADTGCQSCLSGVDLLSKLGLNNSHLVPVSLKMNAANITAIKIIGALPLCITGISPNGINHRTHQIVYFTDSTTRMFLSKQACETLGIISKNFPTIA